MINTLHTQSAIPPRPFSSRLRALGLACLLSGCASSSHHYLQSVSIEIPDSLYGGKTERWAKGKTARGAGVFPEDFPPSRTIIYEDKRPYGIFASGQPVYGFPAYNVIRLYDLKNVGQKRTISASLQDLKRALRDRRDARALEKPYTSLPDFPFRNAGHLVQEKVAYVDFQWGRGVFYLCAFTQGPGNFPTNDGLLYLFQGISHDGRLYVAADFRVTSRLLASLKNPSDDGDVDAEAIEVAHRLNREPDNAFTPDLATIRSWMRDLQVIH